MGVSTDGQICFGVAFDEGFGFPWEEEEYEGDEQKWWRDINGYKSPFELYDKRGEYLDKNTSKDRINEYYKHKHEWEEKNPFPISLVNCCSGEYPQYIIAVSSSCRSCSRGYPDEFDPKELVVTDAEVRDLINFLNKYEIEYEGEPKWYLSSYLG